MNNFKYFIGKNYVNNISSEIVNLPVIRKSILDINIFLKGNELEGPFNSIQELKLKSNIYKQINCSIRRSKILEEKNILEIKRINLIPFEHSYSSEFIYLFLHAWKGKLKKNKVSGIHYKSNEVRIDNIINFNYDNYTYNAKCSVYNASNNKWVSKNQITTFFPDNWTIQNLFKELDVAFNNKTHFNGNVYYGFTTNNIKVKIIIDGKSAKTMYPVCD